MRWVALCALCACTQVLGVAKGIWQDAQPSCDATPDSALGCRRDGTAPGYAELLTKVKGEDFKGYTFEATTAIAVARCFDRTTCPATEIIEQRAIDQPLQPITLTSVYTNLEGPVLAPGGQQLFVRGHDTGTNTDRYVTFDRQGG